MRDITITRQVFTLDELSPAARDKAIQLVRDELYTSLPSVLVTYQLNGLLVETLTGQFDGELESEYVKNKFGVSLEWSLSYSQGDGVAIYGTLDSGNATSLNWGDANKAILTRNHWGNHYTHGNCIDVALYRYDDEGHEIDITDTDYFVDQIKAICRKLERDGYDIIDYYTSESYSIDLLSGSDTTRRFNDDGTFAPAEFWGAQ